MTQMIERPGVLDSSPWMLQAECRYYPPDWWYPEWGEYDTVGARAVRICRDCPVRRECLAEAFAHRKKYGKYGIWGGLTPKQRASVLSRLARKRQLLAAVQ